MWFPKPIWQGLFRLDLLDLQRFLAEVKNKQDSLEESLAGQTTSYSQFVEEDASQKETIEERLAGLETHEENTENPHEVKHSQLSDKGNNDHSIIDIHLGSTSNPHSVSHTQLASGIGGYTHDQIDTHIDDTDQHVGDWTDYAVTWSGGSPSIGNGSIVSRWRRVGQNAEYYIELVVGSTTSTGSGTWSFSLAHDVDTNEFAGSSYHPLGSGWAVDLSAAQPAWASAGISNHPLLVVMNNTTTDSVIAWPVNALVGIGATSPFTWAANDSLVLRFTLPIG